MSCHDCELQWMNSLYSHSMTTIIWWLMVCVVFFTNFTECHCRLNTELLIVCNVALQCLFETACVAVSGVILTRWRVNFSVKITAIIYNITSFTITNSAWAIKIMECRGKLQSNNQVIASQNWVTLKLVGNLVFSVRWRRHFAGAAGHSWSARQR